MFYLLFKFLHQLLNQTQNYTSNNLRSYELIRSILSNYWVVDYILDHKKINDQKGWCYFSKNTWMQKKILINELSFSLRKIQIHIYCTKIFHLVVVVSPHTHCKWLQMFPNKSFVVDKKKKTKASRYFITIYHQLNLNVIKFLILFFGSTPYFNINRKYFFLYVRDFGQSNKFSQINSLKL